MALPVATIPPTLDSYTCLSNVGSVMPAESVEAYKTATNWSYYANVFSNPILNFTI